jgi:hypothetical protein
MDGYLGLASRKGRISIFLSSPFHTEICAANRGLDSTPSQSRARVAPCTGTGWVHVIILSSSQTMCVRLGLQPEAQGSVLRG